MLITGLVLLLAVLTYGVLIQNDPPLRIVFPDATLRPKFNYSFYLTLVTGALTSFLACVIFLVDCICPRKTATFFHHSIIEDDTIFEGEIEEEDFRDEFRQRSSTIRGAEGKIHRKKTASNLRESLRSSLRSSVRSSRSSVRRSDVFPRQKSNSSISDNITAGDSPPNSPSHEEAGPVEQEEGVREPEPGIEMEMVTIHISAEAD